MFYKDDKGIECCELGSGDVGISIGTPVGLKKSECAIVIFSDIKKGEIDRLVPGYVGKYDYEVGAMFKLIFTDSKSVDVVLNALNKIKEVLP